MARNNTQYWLLSVLSILLTSVVVSSRGESEAKTLLKFKNSLFNNTALNDWDESINLCSGDTGNHTTTYEIFVTKMCVRHKNVHL